MMRKKLLAAIIAGASSGLVVDDVFGVALRSGTSGTVSVVNGKDYTAQKGVVWIKARNAATSNQLFSTERGATKRLISDATSAEIATPTSLTAFNSDGYTLEDFSGVNLSGSTYVDWTFLAANGFCDIINYSGDNNIGRAIPHDAGPFGLAIVKMKNAVRNWVVQHRSRGGTKYLVLNTNSAEATLTAVWNDTPADSDNVYLGNNIQTNQSGNDYEMIVFAHDTSPSGIIQCGEYAGNSAAGHFIDLSWPEGVRYILIKVASGSTDGWNVFDTTRGLSKRLEPDTTDTETSNAAVVQSVAGGFELGNFTFTNQTGSTYIYMAIRG